MLIGFLFFPITLFADINSDLQNYFNELGFRSNVTNPKVYLSQQGGFYQGGNLFLRSGIKETPIASVQLPSYRAGCGGIDLYTGAFSFISGKQLEIAMRNIINNAEGFAFELAMETMSPMIAEQMKHLQSLMTTINQQNINSCEMGAALVGSVWPKTQLSQQHVCETVGKSSNIFSDWTAARMGCGSTHQGEDILESAKQQEAFKSLVLINTNIAWEAIKQRYLVLNDQSLAELMMTLSGTIIVKKSHADKTQGYTTLLPRAYHQNLIHALLYGGKTEIYQCDTKEQCLSPTLSNIHIDEKSALQNTVRKMLENIAEHIRLDTSLKTEEISLLNSTAIPIYKILTVQIAYTQGTPFLDFNKYADVIAMELVNQYLTETLNLILQASNHLQMGDEIVKQYKEQIHDAINQLQKWRNQVSQKMDNVSETIALNRVLEQQLAGRLSGELEVGK